MRNLIWLVALFSIPVIAQEPAPAPAAPPATTTPTPPPIEMTPAEKDFAAAMTNVTLTGFFTVADGNETHPDKYTVERVVKIKPDVWNFDARIQYGNRDYKATVAVPVKWAGDTPVLSLNQYLIQGHIYSARILIYQGRYAGTWGAADHGGLMFGRIVRNEPVPAAPAPPQ
jgi:hypothetical protein